MKPDPTRRSPILGIIGSQKESPPDSLMNMPGMGRPKCSPCAHPATGKVRVKGITTCPNTVLHEWLQEQLTHILALLPAPPELSPVQNRERWQHWQEGLQIAPSIGEDMPPLRLLLVLDNLSGHHSPSFVMWLCEHGIMPLYTPPGGSWLNMSESVQRIIVRRALDGEHPSTPQQIIDWLEQTAEGWNADPTPFVWGGKRKRRRDRARDRRHALGGSGAYSRRVLRSHRNIVAQRQEA